MGLSPGSGAGGQKGSGSWSPHFLLVSEGGISTPSSVRGNQLEPRLQAPRSSQGTEASSGRPDVI